MPLFFRNNSGTGPAEPAEKPSAICESCIVNPIAVAEEEREAHDILHSPRPTPRAVSFCASMSLSPWSAVLAALVAIITRLWLPRFLAFEIPGPDARVKHPRPRFPYYVTFEENTMNYVVTMTGSSLQMFCVTVAMLWLVYRAWQVLAKPADELVGLLGLEVPKAPTVSLAGVKADGILLHWKPMDRHIIKYIVRINGVEVGEVSHHESAVTVTNLEPEHQYVVRVVAENYAMFTAVSDPIRIKTLSLASGEFWESPSSRTEPLPLTEAGQTPAPIVQVYRGFSESFPSTNNPPPMMREHSNSLSRVKRADIVRQSSFEPLPTQDHETEEVMQSLQEKLESLRQENEREQSQIEKEDKEFKMQRDTLQQQKDEVMKNLKEKSKASEDLRKEVSKVERERTAAIAKKAVKEKQLKDAEKKREDMKNDLEKWQREIHESRETVAQLLKEKEEHQKATDQKLEELRAQYAEEQAQNKQLEDELRHRRAEIDQMEEDLNAGSSHANEQTQDPRDPAEVQADIEWNIRVRSLQQQWHQAYHALAEANRQHQQIQMRMEYVNQRRASQPHLFNASSSPVDGLMRRDSIQRRRRAPSIRNEQASASMGFMSSAPSFNASISSVSPSFSSPFPYLNINNGMTLPATTQPSLASPDSDLLASVGPMSPTAGDLLPSGLFIDDSERSVDGIEPEGPPEPRPILQMLPGLGAPQTLEQSAQGPHQTSPISVNSRPASVFASPRESTPHLAFAQPSTELVDSDKRSIRSTSSSLRNTGTRFGALFGLNRQRGKTWDHEGPALGSLKSSQTQSLPRHDLDQDPIGTPQRRGSYSSSWMNKVSGTFGRALGAESSASSAAVTRPSQGWGSAALGGLEKPPSPRPGSTKSGLINVLPRPSTESQERFGWPAPLEGLGQRSSGLGTEWGVSAGNSWSRHPSRRPSIQYGASSSALNRDSGSFEESIGELPTSTRSPMQAPIGTRPTSSSQAAVPATPPKQLNPAAPNFMSLNGLFKKGDKPEKNADKKAEKAARKSKEKEKKEAEKERDALADSTSSLNTPHIEYSGFPSDARKSKDNRSLSTAADSPRNSLDRVISLTNSDAQVASSTGKESFMSKLSRKSSSGKFNFPGFSKSKKQASEVGTPDEIDEDGFGMPGFTPRSINGEFEGKGSPALGSTSAKSSALSWSSIKRMGKKGDKTPSLHESTTSEAGDEEDAVGLGVTGQSVIDARGL